MRGFRHLFQRPTQGTGSTQPRIRPNNRQMTLGACSEQICLQQLVRLRHGLHRRLQQCRLRVNTGLRVSKVQQLSGRIRDAFCQSV